MPTGNTSQQSNAQLWYKGEVNQAAPGWRPSGLSSNQSPRNGYSDKLVNQAGPGYLYGITQGGGAQNYSPPGQTGPWMYGPDQVWPPGMAGGTIRRSPRGGFMLRRRRR